MTCGQHEPVAIDPLRIFRVVSQVSSEKHVRERRERHRRTRVSRVGFLNGIHRQDANRVDAKLFERKWGGGAGRNGRRRHSWKLESNKEIATEERSCSTMSNVSGVRAGNFHRQANVR